MSDAARAWPDKLGEFHVSGILGEGAYGTVYAAARELTHSSAVDAPRRLALKVLRSELVHGEELRLFLQEAAALSAIDHPGIAKVFGYGVLPDDRPYLAMERLEGETLAARLQRGPLAPAEAFALFAQIGEALAALAARGIVHRDVQPEHVFLVYGVPYGAGERRAQAVLYHFGVATDAGAGGRGPPSEVYELAVTLYAMLCGRLPWNDPADPEARAAPFTPTEVGASLPAGLESEIMRALSPRPADRPKTVRELDDRLTAAAIAGGVLAKRRTADVPTVSAAEAAARLKTSQKVPTVQPAPAAPAPAPAPEAPLEPAAPTTTRPRRPRALVVLATIATLAVAAAVVVAAFWAMRRGSAGAEAFAPDGGLAASAPGDTPRTTHVPGLVWRHHGRETAVLVGLSWTQVQDAPAGATAPGLAHALSRCGFDPLARLEWLTVGVASVGRKPVRVYDVIVSGRWRRDEVEACLSKVFVATVKREGRATLLKPAGKGVWLGWIDDHTVLVSTRADAGRAWIEARLAGKDSADSAAYRPSAVVQDTSTLWIAGPDLNGRFELTDHLRGQVTWDHPHSYAAEEAHAAAQKFLTSVGLDAKLATVEKNRVSVRVDLDRATTEGLVHRAITAVSDAIAGM